MILRNFISLRAFTVNIEISLRFEISLQFNLKFPRNEFYSAQSHVNADNEVTSHRSEILSAVKSQTGLNSLRVSCKRAL